MSLAVLERLREIGVLRAIGARHGFILTIVQVEGLVIAVRSWARTQAGNPLNKPVPTRASRALSRISDLGRRLARHS